MSWLDRALLRLSARMPVREIRLDGRPYIERHWVGHCCGLTFYLHRYLGADGDREVHDHPWRFALGIPLSGGYLEERMDGLDLNCPGGFRVRLVLVRPWRWNLITGGTFHRIMYVLPRTWTLFVHTPTCKGWGFLRRVKDPLEPPALPPQLIYEQRFQNSNGQWRHDAPRACELRARRGEVAP